MDPTVYSDPNWLVCRVAVSLSAPRCFLAKMKMQRHLSAGSSA